VKKKKSSQEKLKARRDIDKIGNAISQIANDDAHDEYARHLAAQSSILTECLKHKTCFRCLYVSRKGSKTVQCIKTILGKTTRRDQLYALRIRYLLNLLGLKN
jgi:hypothetical protein